MKNTVLEESLNERQLLRKAIEENLYNIDLYKKEDLQYAIKNILKELLPKGLKICDVFTAINMYIGGKKSLL